MMTCSNCYYRDYSMNEEPCKDCIYAINWEAQEQEEEKDV